MVYVLDELKEVVAPRFGLNHQKYSCKAYCIFHQHLWNKTFSISHYDT